MARPKIYVPDDDIKGLKTLYAEGKTAQEMSDYYKSHGIIIARRTLNKKIKELFP